MKRKILLSSLLVLVFALTLVAPQTVTAKSQLPPVFFVAPTAMGSGHSGGSCSSPSFNTIQSAVSAASTGSIIFVCPGTYREQVTISKSLTLIGSGQSQTTILAPSSLSADSFGLQNIVDITGAGTSASLSGFTISGPGPSGVVCSIVFGIFVSGGATANIVGNSIAHVKDNPLTDCNSVGFGDGGIGVGFINVNTGASLTTGHANIILNSLYDDQGNGITVSGSGSTATIIGNTLTGIGSEALSYQNGMEVDTFPSYTANPDVATVSWNTVTGYECPVGTNVAGIPCGADLNNDEQDLGIIVFGPSTGTVVSNNNVYDNDAGMGGSSVGSAVASGVSYSQNNVHNNRYSNLYFYDATNNQIVQNSVFVSSPTASGAPCQSGASDCYPYSYTLGIDMLGGSTNNLIYNNKVTVTADSYAILLDSLSSGNVVEHNTLSANQGTTTGNAAVKDLGTDTVTSNN